MMRIGVLFAAPLELSKPENPLHVCRGHGIGCRTRGEPTLTLRSRQATQASHGTMAIVMCVLIATALTTEVIGIHALLGASLAGAMMPNADDFPARISRRIQALSSVLLLPLFFASTGLRTRPGGRFVC